MSTNQSSAPPQAVAGDGLIATSETDVAPAAKQTGSQQTGPFAGITQVVIVLGVIALFTDMSSEMIMPLRLIFLVQTLATPLTLAGMIEGLAEGSTSILKLISGRLADRFPSRRGLVVAGYSVSNLAKPLLAVVTRWPMALGLILLDRAGKSVRGSPRDAMIADSVPKELRGKAFGFHRSADTLGAAFGPLLAVTVLTATHNNLRAVFGWTLVPGVLSIMWAVLVLVDPGRPATDATQAKNAAAPAAKAEKTPVTANGAQALSAAATAPTAAAGQAGLRAWQGFGSRFWLFTAIATIFALGNSSDAFIFLRSAGLEDSLVAVPLLYFAFNMIYALLATPLGSLSDRYGRLPVLIGGFAAFALVYFGWTQVSLPWEAWLLFGFYGIYYAATEGVARAFVADLVPRERRGTALGWFGGLTGVAALPANILGAWLWSQFGPGVTFGLGAWLAAISCALLIAWSPWLRAKSDAARQLPSASDLVAYARTAWGRLQRGGMAR